MQPNRVNSLVEFIKVYGFQYYDPVNHYICDTLDCDDCAFHGECSADDFNVLFFEIDHEYFKVHYPELLI